MVDMAEPSVKVAQMILMLTASRRGYHHTTFSKFTRGFATIACNRPHKGNSVAGRSSGSKRSVQVRLIEGDEAATLPSALLVAHGK
jgi:hypothetical protein